MTTSADQIRGRGLGIEYAAGVTDLMQLHSISQERTRVQHAAEVQVLQAVMESQQKELGRRKRREEWLWLALFAVSLFALYLGAR